MNRAANKVPDRAMVLAAGLGRRLATAYPDLPKPLMTVGGKALVDHVLDRLAAAGVKTAVVNIHHMADRLRDHLAARGAPHIILSDESDALLDTGGGIARALPDLGGGPFLAVNSDVLWRGADPLSALAGSWDGEAMDALMLMVPVAGASGYDGPGDFEMASSGALAARRQGETAPLVFGGVQIIHPRLFDGCPPGPFSIVPLWRAAARAGRLHGLRHQGAWYHVGTPEGLRLAEAAVA